MKTKLIFSSLSLIILMVISNFIYAQKEYVGNLGKNLNNGEIISSLNCRNKGKLSLTTKPYDEKIIGVYYKYEKEVVSTDGKPVLVPRNNILLNEGVADVKYNSENGLIKAGDPVTSSSTSGEAMKATESGIIIGIALEDAQAQQGLIKIRIMIQYVKQ